MMVKFLKIFQSYEEFRDVSILKGGVESTLHEVAAVLDDYITLVTTPKSRNQVSVSLILHFCR